MTLILDEKETYFLWELLESAHGTLREEIYHAEAPAFRDELKEKEKILQSLIRKVDEARTIRKAS